jgi:hypothetical protein
MDNPQPHTWLQIFSLDDLEEQILEVLQAILQLSLLLNHSDGGHVGLRPERCWRLAQQARGEGEEQRGGGVDLGTLSRRRCHEGFDGSPTTSHLGGVDLGTSWTCRAPQTPVAAMKTTVLN